MKSKKFHHSNILLYLAILVGVVILSLISLASWQGTKESAGAQSSLPFQVKVGRESVLFESSDKLADGEIVVMPYNGKYVAFNGWVNTHRLESDDLNTFKVTNYDVLKKGEKGSFDDCNTTLTTIIRLSDTHWYGLYHAEGRKNPNAECIHENIYYSIAVTESFDGGKTWKKTNYPKNQILSRASSESAGVGSPDVIRAHGKYYLYFLNYKDWSVGVARADIGSDAKPTNWKKYYNGQFSQPGIGGMSSKINKTSTSVSYNSYLNKYISIYVSGRWGTFIQYAENNPQSPDFMVKWNNYPSPLIPRVSFNTDSSVDSWSWDKHIRPTYAYGSIIGENGDSNVSGQKFYLYYMKTYEGDNIVKSRSLLRRQIILGKDIVDNIPVKIELPRFQKIVDGKIKTLVSIDTPKPSTGYKHIDSLGYLNTRIEQAGYTDLHNCYISDWNDYMVGVDNVSSSNYRYCRVEGEKFIRTIGSIAKSSSATANIKVYRCFDDKNLDHFISKDPRCEGRGNQEWPIGHLFR